MTKQQFVPANFLPGGAEENVEAGAEEKVESGAEEKVESAVPAKESSVIFKNSPLLKQATLKVDLGVSISLGPVTSVRPRVRVHQHTRRYPSPASPVGPRRTLTQYLLKLPKASPRAIREAFPPSQYSFDEVVTGRAS